MKAESARQIQELIELEKFNPETLCSGEELDASFIHRNQGGPGADPPD